MQNNNTDICKTVKELQLVWSIIIRLFVFIQYILVMASIKHENVTYNETDHPNWADTVGWMMLVIAVVWIPVEALLAVWKYGFKGVSASFHLCGWRGAFPE